MATVQRYVNPDADPGGDGTTNGLTGGDCAFQSLNVWESTTQQDLTDGGGDIAIATCASGGTADTTATAVNGWATAAASYILIESAPTDRAVKDEWDAAKYRLEVVDDDSLGIIDEYVRVDGLQVQMTVEDGGTYACMYANTVATSEMRFSNCRYVCVVTSGHARGMLFNDADIVAKIWNMIIYGGDYAGIKLGLGTAGIYNCVVYNISAYNAIVQIAGTVTVKNCACFKTANDFDGTITIDYCASDDNDGTNNVAESGGGVDWPDDFVDAANGDFTLKVGSGLKGTGTNDPGSGLYSTDMEGDNYVVDSWSLGVDEYVAAPPAGVPLQMMHYARMRRN